MIALILAAALPLAQDPRPDTPPPRGAPASQDKARTPAEEASVRLRKVELEVTDALLARRPSLARRLGLAPRDLQPLELRSATNLAWRRALDEAQANLSRVAHRDLEPPRTLDLDWMRRWLRAEGLLASLTPEERLAPESYLEELLELLEGLIVRPGLEPDVRAVALTQHLEHLPRVLEQARESLAYPAPEAAAYARLLAVELEHLIAVRMTPVIDASGPTPALWPALDEARDDGLAALGPFGDWLAKASRAQGTARTLGPTHWPALVGLVSGTQLDLDDLEMRLLRDLSRLSLALQRQPAPTIPEARDLDPALLRRSAREDTQRGWRLAASVGLVSGEAPALGFEARTLVRYPGPVARLAGGARPRLVLTLGGTEWTAGLQATRLGQLGPAARSALHLRHGVPGEALWEIWSRNHRRLAQRRAWNRCQREGWGLYAAHWATVVFPDKNPLAADAPLRAAVLRQELLEAARLLTTLRVQARGTSEAKGIEELRALTALDPETAAFELRRSLLDPLHGIGYLGFLELQALEAELGRAGTPQAVRRVAERVQKAPSAPVASLREEAEEADRERPGGAGREGAGEEEGE